MNKIAELKEQRAALALQMNDLTKKLESETRGMTGEEKSSWDKMADEFDALDNSIRAIEKSRDAGTGVDFSDAKDDELSKEERQLKAFDAYLRKGLQGMSAEDRNVLLEQRAQSTGTDTEGGFLTHTEFEKKVDEAMKAYGGMRDVASIISTSTGSDMLFPLLDDTANEGAIVGENAAHGETDLAFAQTSMNAFMYSSRMVKIPYQLLQDALVNVEDIVARAIATRIARVQNKHFTIGTGTGQPTGIMQNVTSATAVATVDYDAFVELEGSIDSTYRNGARYMFNDKTLTAIRKMVDADGRPLWGAGDLTKGVPSSMLGYSYTINNDMADIGTGAKPIVFGDLSKYQIRDVMGLTVKRADELYLENAQVGFIGFKRSGGNTISAGTAFKAMELS